MAILSYTIKIQNKFYRIQFENHLVSYLHVQYRFFQYSLNAAEWKFNLLRVILGITSLGVEIHAQNSGIHSQKSDSNHYFGVDSTILRVDFHSKMK